MYRPPAFREDRPAVLEAAIRSWPLGTLITAGANGLIANVVPFSLSETPAGAVLRAHLAKANEQLVDLRAGSPVLVQFQGPQAYVTPSWYPTKRDHGRVVPTWNYIVVQVRGTPFLTEDAHWLRDQIDDLTAAQERARPAPWAVSDAPESFVAGQLKGIVGLELAVVQIEGKWKLSQNQPPPNRQGVAAGLVADGENALAAAITGVEDAA